MARSIDHDPPMVFKFSFKDIEDGHIGLSNVRISPDGHLRGPGKITVRGAFKEPLVRLLSSKENRDATVTVHTTSSQPLVDEPTFVVHVFGIRLADTKVADISWDACKSDVLCLEATAPYTSLVVTSGALIEQLAAQA